MDGVLHAFWGLTLARIFYKKKKIWLWGVLLGILPDLLGAGPWMYYRNILKVYNIYQIPNWALNCYNATHNLFTSALVFLIIYLIAKKYLFLAFAYLAHIITDIFAHCEPIGIKIFFPLSTWSYCSPLYKIAYGPSSAAWTQGLVVAEIIQYVFLLLINLFLIIKKNSIVER